MRKMYKYISADQIKEIFLVLLILLVVVIFSTQIPNYLNVNFINRISTSIVIISILAVGQTTVFISRNFDLSVGSILGVSAYFVAYQLWHHPGIPPIVALLMCLGVGMLLGSINGLLVSYGKVPSVIATIATLAIFRTFVIEYGRSLPVTPNLLPVWVTNEFNKIVLFSFRGLELRLVFVIMVVVVIIFQLLMKYHQFGRRLYAIGSNTEAARVAGFPNLRIVFLAYVISGTLAGLAGFLYIVRFGNISLQAGMGMEFVCITAVVIGGVSNKGGSGSVIGAFLGALFITLLENSLFLSKVVDEFWRDAILGFLILLAVIIDYVVIGKLRKVWAQREILLKD